MVHQKGARRVVLLVIQLSISSCLLAYILHVIPLSQVLDALVSTTPHFVFLTFILIGLERFILAYQMKRITDGQKMGLSLVQILRINFITSFYELFLPGSLATGVIRWYKLSQQSKMKIPALVAIGFNRLVQWVVLVLIGGVCWTIGTKAQDPALTAILLFVLLVGLLTVYVFFMNNRLFAFVLNRVETATLQIFPASLQKSIAKLTNALDKFHQLPFKAKLEIFGLTLSANTMSIVGWFLLAQALMLPVSIITLAWVRSCIAILVMLPLSIAGLGVREGSLIMLLLPYGITLDEALAFSFLLFFMKICWGTIGGILEGWDFLFFHKRKTVPYQSPV